MDAAPHDAKPTKAEVGAISRRIEGCPFKAWKVADLAAALSNGCTVLPADCDGTRRLQNWKRQQLWFIDVDNDEAMTSKGYAPLHYADAVKRCQILRLPLVMNYETFSSSLPEDPDPVNQRYRLIFARDEVETDKGAAATFGDALLAAFPECDPTTAQPNRLFYGTDKEVISWIKPFFKTATNCPAI